MKKTSKKEIDNSSNIPIDVFLGRAAMVGFFLAFTAYLTVDALVPGFA